jgi:hypothetical protein
MWNEFHVQKMKEQILSAVLSILTTGVSQKIYFYMWIPFGDLMKSLAGQTNR